MALGESVWLAHNSVAGSGHGQLRAVAQNLPTSGALQIELELRVFPLTYLVRQELIGSCRMEYAVR